MYRAHGLDHNEYIYLRYQNSDSILIHPLVLSQGERERDVESAAKAAAERLGEREKSLVQLYKSSNYK